MFDMQEESEAEGSVSNPETKTNEKQNRINIQLKLKEKIDKKLKRKQIEELMLKKVTVNHDAAVYWYRDGTTKVVNDTELAESVKLRGIDPFWKEIYCIQTIVQAKVGLGKPIFVNFIAPVDPDRPDSLIRYDYKKFKADTKCSTEYY